MESGKQAFRTDTQALRGLAVLLHQTGYFAGAAALKPLLHVGTFLYRDEEHLSYDGSIVLARTMHLDALIAAAAH
ncbi:MAG: hypothetical protein ACYCZD_00385 [Rhodanobacter sp.]